jgi:hypothetical protein
MDECKSFQKCIQNFLHRQKKRLEKKHGKLPQAHEDHCKTAISICNHATYLLETLSIKRESLSNAIQSFECLYKKSIQVVKANLESSSLGHILQKMLTHLFVQYIRIRDGFVLLTSGECRHYADAEMAKKEKRFPSRLSSLSKRKDGYTTLYSSKLGYSGYGWDEFHNEEVGIRRRLLDALRYCCRYPTRKNASAATTTDLDDTYLHSKEANASRDKLWDKLTESGAQGFESAFDRHENEMKNLLRQLENIRSKYTSNLEKILSHRESIRVIMGTEDKFERLELKNAGSLGLSEFTIQRQGDAFRGHDNRGALPSSASKQDWMKIMELPDDEFKTVSSDKRKVPLNKSDNRKRKRKVILDSSDEEDNMKEMCQVATNPEDCFKVTVKKVNVNDAKVSASINQIKQQFGVNIDELERRREDMEAEEAETKKAAYEDEAREISTFHQNAAMPPYSEEMFDLVESIQNEEDKIKMYYNVCKRELAGNEVSVHSIENTDEWRCSSHFIGACHFLLSFVFFVLGVGC